MLTIEILNSFGANTKEGLERCLNNESFYLNLVSKAILDDSYDRLKVSLIDLDYAKSFEIAHSLKGVLANLSITPLYDLLYEITEYLRAKKEMDYMPYINKIIEKRNELLKHIE